MNQASHIISMFGGIRPLARLAGFPPSTVQSWKLSGVIPAKHQARILAVGQAAGLEITPDDFFKAREAA